MGDVRSYVQGHFFFNLDGVKCGFVKKMGGGAISAEVVKEAVGGQYVTHKHIGQPKYDDISLDIGFSMSKAVYDWIAASWKMDYQRKNGSLVACDYKLDAKSEREFFNALVTETNIPACDGGSKDPAYLTLKFGPEYTRFKKASGKAVAEIKADDQKTWLPSNFKLEIDGLDCSKVNKVDGISIKQKIQTDDLGDARDMLKEPATIDFPDLKITFAEVSNQPWVDWFNDFVIQGNCTQDKEKNGRLVFLSPNRQEELCSVSFFNLGIFKYNVDDSEANKEGIKRNTVELYCERMELKYDKRTTS
jgi:hypothetical protein